MIELLLLGQSPLPLGKYVLAALSPPGLSLPVLPSSNAANPDKSRSCSSVSSSSIPSWPARADGTCVPVPAAVNAPLSNMIGTSPEIASNATNHRFMLSPLLVVRRSSIAANGRHDAGKPYGLQLTTVSRWKPARRSRLLRADEKNRRISRGSCGGRAGHCARDRRVSARHFAGAAPRWSLLRRCRSSRGVLGPASRPAATDASQQGDALGRDRARALGPAWAASLLRSELRPLASNAPAAG